MKLKRLEIQYSLFPNEYQAVDTFSPQLYFYGFYGTRLNAKGREGRRVLPYYFEGFCTSLNCFNKKSRHKWKFKTP